MVAPPAPAIERVLRHPSPSSTVAPCISANVRASKIAHSELASLDVDVLTHHPPESPFTQHLDRHAEIRDQWVDVAGWI